MNHKTLPVLAPAQYLPLWEVKRNALTTYMVLPRAVDQEAHANLDMYHKLYQGQDPANCAYLDIKILKDVAAELALMEKDGRKFIIACPVQYTTLHEFDSYEEYKACLDAIPPTQRQYLIIYVVMPDNGQIPMKDAYWFAAPLGKLCRHVFAEVPLRKDINFNYLRSTGIDVAGVRVDNLSMSEHEMIGQLTVFCSKSKALKIPMTFITGISSLSVATSCVCAGFNFMGGDIIHGPIDRPDAVQKYKHENLIDAILTK